MTASRRNNRLRHIFGVAASGFLAVGAALILLAPGRAAADDPPPTLPPIDVVVLVDESGSLGDDGVSAEREATAAIASSVLGEGSEVSVVGFGSDVGDGPATNSLCTQVVVRDQESRDQLADCAEKIRPRTSAEGNGTDHVAALRQARQLLGAPDSRQKIVFLLTDGVLDVSDSPSYGPHPEERTKSAKAMIPEVKDELNRVGAQVWPLGFGAAVHDAREDLDGLATGTGCSPATPKPAARVIEDAHVLVAAVDQAFERATCVKFGPDVSGSVRGGDRLELGVDVPSIASDGAIQVFKRDSRIAVAYRSPDATIVDAASPEVAGQTTATETLHIVDPQPGHWTVILTAPPDIALQEVRASVAYQTAVRSALVVDQEQPAAGEAVQVSMSLRTRSGVVLTDPAALAPLTFVAALNTGKDQLTGQVALTDPDQDGTFSGVLTVPDVTGPLVATGWVSGDGISGDVRTRDLTAHAGGPGPGGRIKLVHPTCVAGDALEGEVSVAREVGMGSVMLRMVDATPGLAVDPVSVDTTSGSGRAPFHLRVSSQAAPGGAWATLALVEPNGRVVGRSLFTTTVGSPPWPYWSAVDYVLVAAAAGVVLMSWRYPMFGPRVAVLYVEGQEPARFKPPHWWSRRLRFKVKNDRGGPALESALWRDQDAMTVWLRRAWLPWRGRQQIRVRYRGNTETVGPEAGWRVGPGSVLTVEADGDSRSPRVMTRNAL